MPPVPKTLTQKYEQSVVRNGDDECWGWTGTTRNGYGILQKNSLHRDMYAHRYAYLQANFIIPRGLDVMHRCHNTLCTNPRHLEAGTRKRNMETSAVAGRLQRKIPLDHVSNIKAMRAMGVSRRAIADEYGCAPAAIRYWELRNG